MKSSSLSVAFLILVNLIPIFGVLFLGWDLFSLMLLYWMENVIIGMFNPIKMAFASKAVSEADIQRMNPEAQLGSKTGLQVMNIGLKLFMIPFFMVHYGIFCQVHGFFIMSMFGNGMGFASGGLRSPYELVFSNLNTLGSAFSWALLSMVLSHGLSLVLNYFGQREYKKVSVTEQMFQPYIRIVILHITILIGGFLTMFLGSPVFALVLMAVLKIAVDVWAHLKEHKKFQERVMITV